MVRQIATFSCAGQEQSNEKGLNFSRNDLKMFLDLVRFIHKCLGARVLKDEVEILMLMTKFVNFWQFSH